MADPDVPRAVLPDLGKTDSETRSLAPARSLTMSDLTCELTTFAAKIHQLRDFAAPVGAPVIGHLVDNVIDPAGADQVSGHAAHQAGGSPSANTATSPL
ncbi:hypothetical protein AB0I22_10285 [Streptomyces sp. NPDC050610]|uniref:hypothetical protein n=1 Tax=Streptomyces sp. NPDC050610 TaxID=3157097 RepID=UPI00341A15F8